MASSSSDPSRFSIPSQLSSDASLETVLEDSLFSSVHPSTRFQGGVDHFSSSNIPMSDVAVQEVATLLVDKIWSIKPYNKICIQEAIFKSWSFVKGLEISEGPEDSLIFSFPSIQSRDKILQQGPWNVKGSLLVLKLWDIKATLQEISFTSMNLWLQIYGLPLCMMTRDGAVEYGEKASSVLEVDFNKAKKVWGMAFLRVLVLVDLVNCLVASCYLQHPHKPDLWI